MIRSEFALEAVITSFTAARAIVGCFTVGSVRIVTSRANARSYCGRSSPNWRAYPPAR